MEVTVDLVGGETRVVEVADGTYADIVAELGLSVHEVAVLVDGRPVPEDAAVTEPRVEVLRLISGG